MDLAEFEGEPTKKRHPVYDGSMLYTAAPEWSTGEVLLAAAYRRLLLGVSESAIDLGNISKIPGLMSSAVGGPQTWTKLVTERGGLSSPLRHGQHSPMAARQLMPLVPTIGRVAGVLGKKPRSRWNPSNLLLEAIGAGAGKTGGETLVMNLGQALQVTATDDVFARFVEESLANDLVGIQPTPLAGAPFETLTLGEEQFRAFRSNVSDHRLCPAERFCTDLPSILTTKPFLTRRQWTVLLESMLRLGLGMHALWTCNANAIFWEMVLSVASGTATPTASEVESAIWETHNETRPLLELGENAEPLIERMVERYAYARTGINVLLCRLDESGAAWPVSSPLGASTSHGNDAPAALAAFLSHVAGHRQAIDPGDAGQWLRRRVAQLFDGQDLRALAERESGYTKNLFEFARHSLGQVQAKDADQRCYDLSYLLAYSGDNRKPLPAQPGPAMLVMLVHACCAANPLIPVSLDDFRRHLGEYGLHVPAGELLHGKTGRDLTMLGLVVDSPDAAGGRLLVRPF